MSELTLRQYAEYLARVVWQHPQAADWPVDNACRVEICLPTERVELRHHDESIVWGTPVNTITTMTTHTHPLTEPEV
jgi:hypothetical protein